MSLDGLISSISTSSRRPWKEIPRTAPIPLLSFETAVPSRWFLLCENELNTLGLRSYMKASLRRITFAAG